MLTRGGEEAYGYPSTPSSYGTQLELDHESPDQTSSEMHQTMEAQHDQFVNTGAMDEDPLKDRLRGRRSTRQRDPSDPSSGLPMSPPLSASHVIDEHFTAARHAGLVDSADSASHPQYTSGRERDENYDRFRPLPARTPVQMSASLPASFGSLRHTAVSPKLPHGSLNTATAGKPKSSASKKRNISKDRPAGAQDKPLSQCSYCPMAFKKLEHAQRHERTHTLDRPYMCSFQGCEKTFARQDTLNRHARLHTRTESHPIGKGRAARRRVKSTADLESSRLRSLSSHSASSSYQEQSAKSAMAHRRTQSEARRDTKRRPASLNIPWSGHASVHAYQQQMPGNNGRATSPHPYWASRSPAAVVISHHEDVSSVPLSATWSNYSSESPVAERQPQLARSIEAFKLPSAHSALDHEVARVRGFDSGDIIKSPSTAMGDLTLTDLMRTHHDHSPTLVGSFDSSFSAFRPGGLEQTQNLDLLATFGPQPPVDFTHGFEPADLAHPYALPVDAQGRVSENELGGSDRISNEVSSGSWYGSPSATEQSVASSVTSEDSQPGQQEVKPAETQPDFLKLLAAAEIPVHELMEPSADVMSWREARLQEMLAREAQTASVRHPGTFQIPYDANNNGLGLKFNRFGVDSTLAHSTPALYIQRHDDTQLVSNTAQGLSRSAYHEPAHLFDDHFYHAPEPPTEPGSYLCA
ncbi:uncharacterized protein L969DRAFT_18760 [Mixia osmundae IAM 14324]|uniref:uncharacterized protein n=1 Tax=Mixia osmundae (strain CBS 9802 / IAM 14324 / JCM 22182 / KY 12970) TaxID=764103 RepID=UPI0004A54F13|nr:uncharacterized protein L969DRAFT_18760 [Mixia osmundae IAM 14324]KEI37969.1 hypothetical protein L969DRAFT_18760 [Mixia osmundae IAM 14324]